MKQMTVMEKYPVFTIEIAKVNTSYINVDQILAYLKNKIDSHPVCTYISTFDHYSHTDALEVGTISAEIKDAKNIICCFGKALPKPEMLAVRPRAIGIAEMEESFVVSFMEAPNVDANTAMVTWVKSIENR